MKNIAPLLSLLILAGCSSAPNDAQIQTAIALTQPAIATAPASPTASESATVASAGDISEFQDVAEGEAYKLHLSVTRLVIGKPDALLPEIAKLTDGWSQESRDRQAEYWAQFPTLGAVEITAENTGSDSMRADLYTGSIVINGEQVNPFQSSLDGYVYLNIFEDLLPGARSTTGIYFGLNDTEWSPDFELKVFAFQADARNSDGTKRGEVLIQK